MPREVGAFSILRIQGVNKYRTSGTVTVIMENSRGEIVFASGTDVPNDADVGYACGCLFTKADDGVMYSNRGSATSSNFDALAWA